MNIPAITSMAVAILVAAFALQEEAIEESIWRTDLNAAMEESLQSQRPIVAVFR